MADITPDFDNKEFWNCCFDLKASRIEADDLRPRGKETVKSLRREFYYAVRHIFLKYLPLVERDYMEKTFSQGQIETMRYYNSTPEGWNIHHQKSLSWGGRSFDPDYADEIRRYPLTTEQEEKFGKEFEKILEEEAKYFTFEGNIEESKEYAECRNLLKFRFQMDNYLAEAQAKNKLESAFCRLFKGFLILLPKEKHDNLETFIEAQKAALATSVNNGRERQEIPPSVRITYPVWNQLVYGGNSFKDFTFKEMDTAKANSTKKSKEFRMSKLNKLVKKENKRDQKKKVKGAYCEPYRRSRHQLKDRIEKLKKNDDYEYGN